MWEKSIKISEKLELFEINEKNLSKMMMLLTDF